IRAVTVDELSRALDRRHGTTGAAGLRDLVALAAGDSESVAERLFARLLREAGIVRWVQQAPFGRWRLDFAWPEARVAVEIHGWAFHYMHDRFNADQAKGNALEAEGWRLLTFPWHQLTGDPLECVRVVA